MKGRKGPPTYTSPTFPVRMPILSAVWIILLAASVPFNTNAFSADNIRTTMPERMLNPVSHADVSLEIKDPVDETALGQAKAIIAELRSNANGPVDASKLLDVAKRLGDLPADHSGSYAVSAEDCKAAFESLDDVSRNSLVNIHSRVKVFAEAQRKSVTDIEIDIPGGKAGHTVSPCRGSLFCTGLLSCIAFV